MQNKNINMVGLNTLYWNRVLGFVQVLTIWEKLASSIICAITHNIGEVNFS